MPAHVKKGDVVIVTAGDDKGKTGEIVSVDTKASRVVVRGVNIHKRHLKPTQGRPKGAIVEMELPIHMSNVSPVVDGKPTRVRFATKADGSKVRVAARNGAELSTLHGPRTTKKAK
ncbi:MAG: 50S ribosomal protein L24 [Planctomycetes bacterium]|nr:50S ribosomal protein L24 [Planctomycetota bacterium]